MDSRPNNLLSSREVCGVQPKVGKPYEKMSALLAVADVHLVLQKKSASDLVMPSKRPGILASGGCALVTASPGTSLYEVVARHQLGILVEPESVEALAQGLEAALATDLTPYRVNARAFAEKHLNKEAVLGEFELLLGGIVGGGDTEAQSSKGTKRSGDPAQTGPPGGEESSWHKVG